MICYHFYIKHCDSNCPNTLYTSILLYFWSINCFTILLFTLHISIYITSSILSFSFCYALQFINNHLSLFHFVHFGFGCFIYLHIIFHIISFFHIVHFNLSYFHSLNIFILHFTFLFLLVLLPIPLVLHSPTILFTTVSTLLTTSVLSGLLKPLRFCDSPLFLEQKIIYFIFIFCFFVVFCLNPTKPHTIYNHPKLVLSTCVKRPE